MHTLADFLAGLAFSLGAVLDAGFAALVAAPPFVFATLEARVSLVPSDASVSAARFLGGIGARRLLLGSGGDWRGCAGGLTRGVW